MKHVPGKIKDKYEILGIIGEGAYGVVLKARRKDSNTIVAIKHFKQTPGYCSDVDVIERELKILQSLRFENVVELIEWFRNKKQCFLIFEYVEWNMLQVLQQHPEGLSIDQVRSLSYQLFSAINWCHIHEIIHRDIKPENLLISKNFILKLCDFGFARFCNTQTSADYYTGYVATRWYRSPELLIASAYGKPVDIWACGCIMAELATGQALFAGESDIDQLYRIQKCLGPLPTKYMEAMRSNPKFEGLKFPPIHHLDTLERRFGQLFPPDIMHLFKHTLRLHAIDRLTAQNCIQHQAYIYLNHKRFHRQHHRPKNIYNSMNISQPQIDHHNETVYYEIPSIDHRLSKSYDENNETHIRRRSPDNLTDISFAVPQIKYRSHTQLNDRSSPSNRHQPKIIRTQSSSSNEQNQPPIFSPRSSNEASDNDDEPNNIFLRRKYLKNHQSIREQQLPSSPTLRYASNGVLLRPKQQPSINLLQTSSNDMSKRFKRFSLDQQQTLEPNIYRSSMAIVPNHPVQINNSHNNSLPIKQIRDESNNELQQRPKTRETNRDLVRSRTVDCHPPIEVTPIAQRTSSRQALIMQHQMVQDPMDQVDIDSTSRNLEQQQQNNKHPWNGEQRRPIYGSDSHLMNSNGHNSSFSRPFYSPAKNDYTHMNRTVMTPQRDSSHDPIKSAKLSSKQNVAAHSKTPSESNRKQQSSLSSFGVYPFARTAILHVANALMPSSHQRQQSIRFLNTKSRHHDR